MRIETLEKLVCDTANTIMDAEKLQEFITFMGTGNLHHWSVPNLLAIYAQKPSASLVIDFTQWKKKERYPVKNSGIAVYPFNTSGVMGSFCDYVFDVDDTKVKSEDSKFAKISTWILTEEIKQSYLEINASNNNESFEEFFKRYFYESVEAYAAGNDLELLYGENEEQLKNIRYFISDCCLKVFLTRCSIPYKMDPLTNSVLQTVFCHNDTMYRMELFMKCLGVVQKIAHNEITRISAFVIAEKRRMKNERNSLNGYGYIGRTREENGSTESDRDRKSRVERVGESERGGSVGKVGIEKDRNLSGNGKNLAEQAGISEKDCGLDERGASGTFDDNVESRNFGSISGSESAGSKGILFEESSKNAESGKRMGNGFPNQNSNRTTDSSGFVGNNQSGDPLQTDQGVSDEKYGVDPNGQLSLFTFFNHYQESDEFAKSITITSVEDNEVRRAFSDEEIEQIIMSGANGYNLYCRDNLFCYYAGKWESIKNQREAVDDTVNYIKKQYAGAALGFEINHRKISVFYDKEKGMILRSGEESRLYPEMIVSWDRVESYIYNLIADNRFIDKSSALAAKAHDERELITELIYYFIDGFHITKEECPEPFCTQLRAFPQIEDAVRDAIRNKETANSILQAGKLLWERCERGEIKAYWMYAHEYSRMEHLEAYINGYYDFELPDKVTVLKPSFITMDSFDEYLGLFETDTKYRKRKLELYEAANGGSDVGGVVKYLKRTWGESGTGYMGFQASHSGKGFEIKLATDAANWTEGELKQRLSDKNIAKRICRIIGADKLLLDDEKIIYSEWKRERDEEGARRDTLTKMLEEEKNQLQEAQESKYEKLMLDDTVITEEVIEEQKYEEKLSTVSIFSNECRKPFHYTDMWEPNTGSAAERFEKNITAITLLKAVEDGAVSLTERIQSQLSQYVGWGGLSAYFDESREDLAADKKRLQSILTEEEYKSARSSVTDSFYTPREIIDGIYQGLKKFGFRGGNILEPSMGIGNFYNAMPEKLEENSKLYGVEVDSISGRIARLLHPNCNIQICGIENAKLESNFFDCIIGNVPFGEFKIFDKQFNKENFLIHDYFFAKSLELCAPGGLVCLITSKGTLDKKNGSVRRYISERANFIGAIRLPNTTFKDSANTEVTSDIIFLQKKMSPSIQEQEFESVEMSEKAIPLNSYFISNPHMMLGHMEVDMKRFGPDRALSYLVPNVDTDLKDDIAKAISCLPGNIYQAVESKSHNKATASEVESIPADSSIKNYTYTVRDGIVYMRENSKLIPQTNLNSKQKERIVGMCKIRTILRELISLQLERGTKQQISECQKMLSDVYDGFVSQYGYINDRNNKNAFYEDVEYTLLCALEDSVEGKFVKAKIFTEQTIYPKIIHDKAESAVEALNITVADYGYVNMENVLRLYGKSLDVTLEELGDEVFLNPDLVDTDNPLVGYETKEEYLSGNVRSKLADANIAVLSDPRFEKNARALENVIPKDLDASEIDVKIGVNWVTREDYQQFIYDTLKIPYYQQRNIYLEYNPHTNTYFIQAKSDCNSVEGLTTYGTDRMNALEIFETLLNLRQIQIKDRIEEGDGKVSYVLNEKATLLARAKADSLKEKFKEWIFKNMERRERYVRLYNDRFNNIKIREYDGSFLEFPGMNPEITFRPHQKNAVARIIRGGNTLLGHCVGAGKSFEMAAAAMELKRLAFANKIMIVVPNHLTGQMANEFLKLYPSANILLTRKEDFEKNKRKRFISKIATGSYDAVIIGYSQFEKIPISKERQEYYIEEEISMIQNFILQMKYEKNQRWSIKQMEAQVKQLHAKLEILANEDYKDNVITFEELGVDCLMVDEAHNFKNLSFNTKIGNVSGINPNGSLKAYDLSLKVRYINEIHPGRNVIFATGTPISNTICEMYLMQRYLQADMLKERGLTHFDAWAANFGEITTAMELSPEGKGYRPKTRFSKFTNLPELVSMFRMVADIQTQEMLPYLKVPKLENGKYRIIESEANDDIKACVDEFVERARVVREGGIDATVDNMLKICHDARLVSTDIRMYVPDAQPDPDSKLYKCVTEVYNIWKKTAEEKAAQVIFCDIGVPNADKERFGVYQFIKKELVKKGIPENEICFIHDAKNDKQRNDMFAEVRNGIKRIILGSTEKMGTGTNIQDRLYALHEIDVPWRPSDVEQREGRILRQGNKYDSVEIFRYVTKGTFDAYNWNIIENKQRFIAQIMTDGDVVRNCADIDETVLNYAEMVAVSSGNPLLKEKMTIDADIARLNLLKREFTAGKYRLEKELKEILPKRKEHLRFMIENVGKDIERRNTSELYQKSLGQELIRGIGEDDESVTDNFPFFIKIQNIVIDERKKAGEIIKNFITKTEKNGSVITFGEYAGFNVGICKRISIFNEIEIKLVLSGNLTYEVDVNPTTDIGNIIRIQNAVRGLEKNLQEYQTRLSEVNAALASTQEEFEKPFSKEGELKNLLKRQQELSDLLSMDNAEQKESSIEVVVNSKRVI